MQVQNDILRISSNNLSDSIYDIKNALEDPTICRVRKIFATCCNDDPDEHSTRSKPNKKIFYIWVEWTNTNMSHMFTARLTHQGEHALFKQDKWGHPIVTERDEYGNATEHAHWIVRRSSRSIVQDDEELYIGVHREEDEEVWQTYLAEGETVEDTDDEEEEEEDDQKDDEQEQVQEEEDHFPPMPQLKRANAVTAEEIHADQILSLSIPWAPYEEEQEEYEPPEANESALKEIFTFHESALVFPEPSAEALTRKQLEGLTRGILPTYND
jgi:hypothetical protein